LAFFHCQQNAQVLECDVFQTLIRHGLSPEKRAEYINQEMQDDPVGRFADKQRCEGVAVGKKVAEDAVKTGRGADGRPVTIGQAKDLLLLMSSMDDACHNPTLDKARRFFEEMADQKMRTCKVFNDYSHSRFTLNPSTQSWVFNSGPSGPCGTVIVGTLEHDRNVSSSVSAQATAVGMGGFWLYTERHIFTNRNGMLPNGLSCNEFPDSTLHYTWRAALDYSEYTIIEDGMN
jgi:hypothetical protein